MRFLAHVLPDGSIRPVDAERTHRHVGRDIWVSIHENPAPTIRSGEANRFYWGACVRAICEATGSDPESCHYGLKREAVRLGVLDPEFILLGNEMLETEPTTVTDSETFSRYVTWVCDWARTKLDVHIEDV